MALPVFLENSAPSVAAKCRGGISARVIDKTVGALARIVEDANVEWNAAATNRFFSRVPAVVKIVFFSLWLVLISAKQTLVSQAALGGSLFLLAAATGIPLPPLFRRAAGAAFIFGFLVPLPTTLLNGHLDTALLLFARVFNSVATVFALLFSTPFPSLLRALRKLGVPSAFVLVFSLTRSWLVEFSKTVQSMALAKKSRTVGALHARGLRAWQANRLADLFFRTQMRADDIWRAMRSRTLTGPALFTASPQKETFFNWETALLFVMGLGALLWL